MDRTRGFQSVAGTAEATGLAEDSVDIVESILEEWGTDYTMVRRSYDVDSLTRLFGGAEISYRSFPNEQLLGYEALEGRLLSSSYMPTREDPDSAPPCSRHSPRCFVSTRSMAASAWSTLRSTTGDWTWCDGRSAPPWALLNGFYSADPRFFRPTYGSPGA